jgi:prepilin-type N-terminal cleavage/methylation domain-containing protein
MGIRRHEPIRKDRGFTLIELLVVIAIIAILAAILMVAVRKGIQAAQKTRAASHMRQIILAYESCTQGWSSDDDFFVGVAMLRDKGEVFSAHHWIAGLAKRGYFNDPRLVAFDFDPLVNKYTAAGFLCYFFGKYIGNVRPTQIWNKTEDTFGDGFKNMPLSLCFNMDFDSRKATAHTPLLWTRGLNEEGTWNPIEGSKGDGSDGGIWGDSGGLIGFIGGCVEWFESLTGKNALPTYDGSGTTSNIQKAINDSGYFVDWMSGYDSTPTL